MPTSPPAGAAAEVAVAAALVAAVEPLLLLLPQAASTNAPKLAAPAPPTIFRNRLRSVSSRTKRSTIPGGSTDIPHTSIFGGPVLIRGYCARAPRTDHRP